MSTDHNHVTVIGRLGRDPELKVLPDGGQVANFSIASDEGYKDKDGQWQSRTNWFDVTAWGNQASAVATHCTKGSKVFIDGKLTHRQWEASDGSKRSKVGITAHAVTFMGAKPEGQTARAAKPVSAAEFKDIDFGGEDDIPW